MRGIDGIGNWILILMATASLISMIAVFSLNGIVSNDLSDYGLQFSYNWAIPFWNSIGLIFAMAWLNIIAVIVFQIYRIRTIRKEEGQKSDEHPLEEEQENYQSGWNSPVCEDTVVIDGQTSMQEVGEQTQSLESANSESKS